MTSVETQTNLLTTLVSAPVAAAILQIFGADWTVLAIAFLGAWFGLSQRPAPEPAKGYFELLKRFAGNVMLVLFITISATLGLFYFLKQWPGAQYPLAFFTSFLLMFHKEMIIKKLGDAIGRKIDGV